MEVVDLRLFSQTCNMMKYIRVLSFGEKRTQHMEVIGINNNYNFWLLEVVVYREHVLS